MALSQKEIEALINELETRLERLRHLYDQYFLGFEKLAPEVPRKDVERRISELRRDQIRNTALRFRFNVITQKYQTYQSFWQRVCRQIEEGTFKRHLQRAAKRFGVNAKKGRIDYADLDIDVDLGELESQVEEDMKSIDDGLSDDDRRILREVESEMRGENATPDTERPNAARATTDRAKPSLNTGRVIPPHAVATPVVAKYDSEDDDDGDDLPTNRPPSSVTAERLAISMPKNPVPSFTDRPQTAAPLAAGTARPIIRKATEAPGPAGASGRVLSGAPQIRRTQAPVMPLVSSAPSAPSPSSASVQQKPSLHSPAGQASGTTHPQSAGRIALPVPGAASRKPPENMPSPESGSIRAAPEKSAIRSSPQEATDAQQAQQQAQQPRVAGLGVPGRASAHMRGAPIAPIASSVPTNVPPSSSKAPASTRTSSAHSKPPPPLPSSMTTRGRSPSLAELADAAKKGEKDSKKP